MKFSFEVARSANKSSNVVKGDVMRSVVVTPENGRMARTLHELNARMFRAYDAALTGNFNADFKGTYTSANTEIIMGDYTVRARTRTLAKDTPHGKAIVRTFQNNVVGDDPFRLDMRFGTYQQAKSTGADAVGSSKKFVEDSDFNNAVQAEWEIQGQPENWTVKGDMSRAEAFRIMEASVVREGYVLLRHHDLCPFTPTGYATELLEADRLQSQFQGKSDDGNPIRFSIEFDKRWNRKVAYWLLAKHPGDATGQSILANINPETQRNALAGSNNFRVRIDASEVVAFHNLRDRAEQDVGFTELDACTQSLWRLFQYEKALTYAAIASCCKPFWIKKNFPTGMQYSATSDELASLFDRMAARALPGGEDITAGNGPTQGQQGLRQRQSTEVPGSTLEMELGSELMQTDPKFPIEAAHDFRQDNLRDIAVAAGVSYQDVSGDFQNLGFAAALMCQTPKQDYCKIRQRNFIDCVVRPVFRRWLRRLIMSGILEVKYGLNLDIKKLEDYVQAAKFKAKRWAFVNPLVQAQTLIIMMEAKIISPQQVQDQLPDGVSIEDLYTMLEEDKAEKEKHGIVDAAIDPTRPDVENGQPGETDKEPTEEKPPSKKKTSNPVRSKTNGNGHNKDLTMDLISLNGDGR